MKKIDKVLKELGELYELNRHIKEYAFRKQAPVRVAEARGMGYRKPQTGEKK